MKTNPFLLGTVIAVAVAAVYFAYSAGQRNPGAAFVDGMKAELERLRTDYDDAADQYDADLKELRAEFTQKIRDLEQSVYGLREQLARAGVEIGPMGARTTPGARGGSEAAPVGPITKEAFYQLRTNMSLQDVERIFGRAGEMNYRMAEEDGTSTENYRWKWFNIDGTEGQITVSFRNNKLDEKEFWGEQDEQ